MRIVILGGGPCGLGAAWRLNELGHADWTLYERADHWGGLSASFRDEAGFWWDIGGHVLFSHYTYFDRVMDRLLGAEEGWLRHRRESWVWMEGRFIPYPLQNHIHRLPKDIYRECLEGIISLTEKGRIGTPENFRQWLEATFGPGLCKWFMFPYNFKVWAWPPETMDWRWVGERVAPVDLRSVLRNAVFEEDTRAWGPNAHFRFPRYGGTGTIWRTLAEQLPAEKAQRNAEVVAISPEARTLTLADGTTDGYDLLISTLPVTRLLEIAGPQGEYPGAEALRFSGTHVVGLALNGRPPDHLATKCWSYFPESDCPFYRGTVFSNYSPNNVPDPASDWSLMLEVSQSNAKPVDAERVVDDVIEGAVNTKLIADRRQVRHTWSCFVSHGYPTPSLDRNVRLFPILNYLKERNICSRGRFGAWRYEVGNMDHSFMQGVECANAAVASGEELTLWYPDLVNAPHPSGVPR